MDGEPKITVFRPQRPGIRKVLGDLEAEIMETIWRGRQEHGMTVRAVFDVMRRRRRIAYTTVMSTMARLAKKQLLRVEKLGQAYIYHPNVSQDEFISGFVGRILENLVTSFTGATIEGLRAMRKNPKAAARARQLLAEIARRRAAGEEER